MKIKIGRFIYFQRIRFLAANWIFRFRKRPARADVLRFRSAETHRRDSGSSLASKPALFALEVHSSVIQDAASNLEGLASLRIWSIAGSNRIFRPSAPEPDPVMWINASTFQAISPRRISRFRHEYREHLESFDGFIATHAGALVQIYKGLGKPILFIASSRYETPYTSKRKYWETLNQDLWNLHSSGMLTLVANNRADQAYFETLTGIKPRFAPSLCEYVSIEKFAGKFASSDKVALFAKDARIRSAIKDHVRGFELGSAAELFPQGYTWADLSEIRAAIVIPYNISTMTLFELARLGVTVLIPSDDFLKSLRLTYTGVLSELLYHQVEGLPLRFPLIEGVSRGFIEQLTDLDWWLQRADWNTGYMPNVHRFNDFHELGELIASIAPLAASTLRARNHQVKVMNQEIWVDFLNRVKL